MAGSSSKSSTTAVDVQAEDFKGLRGEFSELLRGSFGDISSLLSGDLQFGLDPGDLEGLRAGISPGEQEALGTLGTLAGGSENERLSSDLLGSTLRGDFLDVTSNEGLRDLIRFTNQTISEEFNAEDLAQRGLFARAGQVLPESSPFAQASADLSKARLDAIGRNTAQLTSQSFQLERDRQVQAVEAQRANASFQFERQLEFLQSSALPRLIDEIGFERAFETFNSRLNLLAAALGVTADVTAPAVAVVGKTKSGGGGLSITGASSTSGAAS